MTNVERWLLPDGIEEILPPEAGNIEQLRRQLLDLLHTWGYDLVIPPMAEYLESLLTGVGHDLDLLTFKITDQLSGRMMGLTADNTQQVARMDTHSLSRDYTSRYCYSSPVLHTRPASIHASRSPIQIGAELYGIKNVSSDIEIVSLMLEMLQSIGINRITLDLGHVAIYRSLIQVLELPEKLEHKIYSLLRDKSFPDLNNFILQHENEYQDLEYIGYLSQCIGSKKVLAEAQKKLSKFGPSVDRHFDRLNTIAETIELQHPEVTINFDLAELKDYNYHTGLVFSAFVPKFGHAIAKGGRYDATGEVFGASRPATGFSADLKVLARLIQNKENSLSVFAPVSDDPELLKEIFRLRHSGMRVIQAMTPEEDPKTLSCSKKLVLANNAWTVQND